MERKSRELERVESETEGETLHELEGKIRKSVEVKHLININVMNNSLASLHSL